jgi:hypothetical protein
MSRFLMVELSVRRSRELGPRRSHGESRSIDHHFTCCIAVQFAIQSAVQLQEQILA